MKAYLALVLMVSTSAFAYEEFYGRFELVSGDNCYDKEIDVNVADDNLQISRISTSSGSEKSYLIEEFDKLNQGRQKKRINERPKYASRNSYYKIVYSNYENTLTQEGDSYKFKSVANNRVHTYSEYMLPGENYLPNPGAWIARPFEIAANMIEPSYEKDTYELEYSGSELKITKNNSSYVVECLYHKK